MVDIPRSVRYDWLLILLGIGLMLLPKYYGLNSATSPLVVFIGLLILTFGLDKMKYQYDLEMDMVESKYAEDKMKFLKKFLRQGILQKKSYEIQEKDIKKIINKK